MVFYALAFGNHKTLPSVLLVLTPVMLMGFAQLECKRSWLLVFNTKGIGTNTWLFRCNWKYFPQFPCTHSFCVIRTFTIPSEDLLAGRNVHVGKLLRDRDLQAGWGESTASQLHKFSSKISVSCGDGGKRTSFPFSAVCQPFTLG